MRQRVKLAQSIAHDPEVLLLDEPVSGMDPVNRRRVIDLVRKLGREGKTVVVSSHILYEVEAMTKRVLLVHNGRILAEGDVREIRDLLDEHPHTVALRAREPRRLAAAIVGWPNVLSVTFGGEGEWVTVRDRAPGRVLRGAPRGRARVGGRRDVLARREPGVGLQVPGGAMRDTSRPLPFAAAARAVFDLSLEGMVWTRRSLLMALLVGAARSRSRSSTASSSSTQDARAAGHAAGPLRGDRGPLLDPQRAAARRALLRHVARRRRGRGPDPHVPGHPSPDPRLDLRREVRGLPRHDAHPRPARRRADLLRPPERAAAGPRSAPRWATSCATSA